MAKRSQKITYEDSDDDVDQYLKQHQAPESDDDDFNTISFGALKDAQAQLDEEEGSKKPNKKSKEQKHKAKEAKKELKKEMKKVVEKKKPVESDSEDEMSEGLFEEEDSDFEENQRRGKNGEKKKNKHAPSEQSSKRPVPKVRKIPGLETPKESSLYRDIRFDTAFGKADVQRIRQDYKFLDEYRQKEIEQIDKMLRDPKMKNKLSYEEIQDLEYQAKSLRSRLDTLKNRDLQQDVLKKYKEEHNIKGKFFLKKSDQRKIIQKHKFENMKASQREKVVERKRKRRLGKEFKQLEFRGTRER